MPQTYRVEPRLEARQRPLWLSGLDGREPEWVAIGRLAELGPRRDVRLGVSQEHVLAIVGKRGSGKSFTLGSVLEGLCTSDASTAINQVSLARAALLFDTLNIFQWMTASVLDRAGSSSVVAEQAGLLRGWGGLEPVELSVDLWVPAGYESRTTGRAIPFQIRPWDMDVSDWAALLHVDAVQDPMGQLVSLLVDKVSRRGWRREDGTHVRPNEEYSIGQLIACLDEDPEIGHDYQRETVRAVRQRLSSYEGRPLFGTQGTSLTHLLRPGRLSIMLLSAVPDDVRSVIIFLTIRKLLVARALASEATKSLELGFGDDPAERARLDAVIADSPPKTWVVVDEAQNIFPSERQTSASATLLRFVREGRNFGLSLAFTTQQPSAIDARVMAQVDTLLAHTLTVQRDIANVLGNLKAPEPDSIRLHGSRLSTADAIRALDVGQAFVTSTEGPRSFLMDVRPRVSIHGGFES
jgi:uncharacterized protein